MKKREKRIAFFISAMTGGGAQIVLLNLASGMSRRGHPIDIVLSQAKGDLLSQIPPEIRIINLNAKRVLFSLPALMRYLKKEQPHTLISSMNYVNIIAIWAKRFTGLPKRLIISAHTNLHTSSEKAKDTSGKLMPFLVRRFYPWADQIVAVSKGVASELSDQLSSSQNRIHTIYNPVIIPGLDEKISQPLDHPWFQKNQPPVILAVGRLDIQKDYPTLIRAFAKVRDKRPARLLILGEGRERPELEALIRQLNVGDDISMPGFVKNPYPFMARASLFVCSSRWEGLSLVLIEAMYCGTPMVSTDCPYGPQEVLQQGKYGQLVPIADVDSLADAIDKNLTRSHAKFPRESWAAFEEETVINQYLEIAL